MSNFLCEKCLTYIIDSPEGYVQGCSHYPIEKKCTCSYEHAIKILSENAITHNKNCPKYQKVL